MDVIGTGIVGIPLGNKLPKITVNGAVDALSMTAASSSICNLDFAISTTDAATAFVNIAAANCVVKNITGIGSVTSYNVVDLITITSAGSDTLIDGVQFWNSIVAVNSFLSLEGAASRITVKNFNAFGDCATAGIIDAAKVDYLWLENVKVATVGSTIPAAILDSNPEGIAINCYFAGTSTTLANNAALGNLMRLFNVWVTEQTDGSAQGAQIPAVDAD
jgi:hypothetical protein